MGTNTLSVEITMQNYFAKTMSRLKTVAVKETLFSGLRNRCLQKAFTGLRLRLKRCFEKQNWRFFDEMFRPMRAAALQLLEWEHERGHKELLCVFHVIIPEKISRNELKCQYK